MRVRGLLLALLGLGSVLEVAFVLDHPGELAWYRLVSFCYFVVAALVYIAVAEVIHRRNRSSLIGWLLMLFAAFPAMSTLANGYTIWELPGSTLVTMVLWIVAAPAGAALAAALVLFPTEHVSSARWRWLVWACGAAAGISVILAIVAPWPHPPYPNDTYFGSNPLAIEALDGLAGTGIGAGFVLVVAAMGSVLARYRAAAGIERAQIRAIGLAGLFLAVVLFTAAWSFLARDLDSTDSGSGEFLVGDAVFVLGASAIAIAIGIGVVRYKLYGLDRLFSRALTYTVLVLAVTALVAVGVAGWSALASGSVNPVVVVVVGTAIVVVVQPLRSAVESRVEMRVFGSRPGSRASVRQLARDLSNVDSPGTVLELIAEAAKDVSGARAGRVDVVLPDATELGATAGDSSVGHWDPILEVRGSDRTTIGRVAIAAGDGRARDLVILDKVVSVASGAMESVRLQAELERLHESLQMNNRELAASHRRLVVASDEERERFVADVREQIDPHLDAISESLFEASTAQPLDAAAVSSTARALQPRTLAVVELTRALSRAVVPPVLADLGPVAALRSVARRIKPDAAIEVDADIEGMRFEPDVEAVAFLCGRDLIEDASERETGSLQLALSRRNGHLRIDVQRDGSGWVESHNLIRARDRLQASGGNLVFDGVDQAGLRATIPLPGSRNGDAA